MSGSYLSYLLQSIVGLTAGGIFYYLTKKGQEEREARWTELDKELNELIRKEVVMEYEETITRLTREGKQSVLIAFRTKLQLDGYNEQEVKDLSKGKILEYLKFIKEREENKVS